MQPRRFNHPTIPSHRLLKEVLPSVLSHIHHITAENGPAILQAWPSLLGPRFAQMTQAEMFREGILTISVANSSLYHLLVQHEKNRLLSILRAQFPTVSIRGIRFRLGRVVYSPSENQQVNLKQ